MKTTKIPRNVWVAGWVSFFMDVSSEMVYPLVPLFLSSTLGASKSVIGLIEGIAESSASVTKLFSGVLADRFGKHKLLMTLGYGISTASRPVLALATGWGLVLTARFTDRVGKGFRTAPRDAIIAASTESDRLGLAFGIHRTLDTAGAIVGPAVALLILAVWAADYRSVFWLSILPGLVSIALIAWIITPGGRSRIMSGTSSWSFRGLGTPFVGFLLVVGLFSLGNSSKAFMILKAQHVGVTPMWITGIYMAFNVSYVLVSIPAGVLADRLGKPPVIIAGFILFALVYAGFAMAANLWAILGLFILYGVYMGLTEGVQRAYLATLVPEGRMATGFGLYHMIVGLAILPASLIAGMLWDHISPAAPFWFGTGMAVLATLAFIALTRLDVRSRR